MQKIEMQSTEQVVFNPYNPLNKEITESEIFAILKKHGLPEKIRNINIYKTAFVHRSYTIKPDYENDVLNIVLEEKPKDCLPLKKKCNETLEFLGDGLLEACAHVYLMVRFPKKNEGFMTETKIAIVKNEAIGKIAYDLGLHKWLIISSKAEEKGVRTNYAKLGCLFEAFIGAIYMDNLICDNNDNYSDNDNENEFNDFEKNTQTKKSQIEKAQVGKAYELSHRFIENVFNNYVNWTEILTSDTNYKNLLQVKLQKEFKTTPTYLEIEHNAEIGFKMGVYIYLGKQNSNLLHSMSKNINDFSSLREIHETSENEKFMLIFMAEGQHKIKKKAEQIACELALKKIEKMNI